MEHSVLEQITGVESVSTMKILGYASENNISIHMIGRENLSDELALLDISDQVKQEISSSVNSGKLVIIPEQDITINQWSGIGYMVLDPDTYACGYMISGGMAGGAMTWDEVLAAVYLNVREGFKTMLEYMAVLVMFPELWPVFVVIACISAFSVGWSIGTHIYNCITTGDVREYQEAMIEIASFCFLIAIGEGIKKAYREPETAKQAGDEMAMAGKNNSCFIAGTLVSTKSGMVSIETISVGDIVYSFNAETQEVSEQTVEEIFIRQSNQLVYLNVGNETITTTPEHPFYIPQKGFVNAIDLRAGDTLWTVNGEYVIIEKIQHEILESPVKVYNFRVANNHTYFVGSSTIGVHNSCDVPWYNKSARIANNALDNGASNVTVDSQAAAEELFLNRYAGKGYRNTTGMSGSEVRDFYGSKNGTYHWDTVRGSDGYIQGHNPENPDALLPHLQVFDDFGNKVTIFFYD